MLSALHDAYRRTGADLPFGDPRRAHGVGMEGYFWRIADPAAGHALIVLCGACRSRGGTWGLVGVAAHPGGTLHVEEVEHAVADPAGCGIRAGEALTGDSERLRVDIPGAVVDLRLRASGLYARRAFGALGPAHCVPGLHQYWHPHLLSARVEGHAIIDGTRIDFRDAVGYAEKNWGAVFAGDWWWGQAADLAGGEANVAFAGGRLEFGGLRVSPTSVVVGIGDDTLRLVPPLARTTISLADGAWRLRAVGARHTVELEGDAGGSVAHELPVPLPGQRTIVPASSRHHLAGRLELTVRRGRRMLFRGESRLAGLERGHARPVVPPR